MVLPDLEQPALVVEEPVLVRGQGFLGVEVGQVLERAEIVAQRVVAGLRVEVDVGGDARQHAVAGEHEPVGGLPEAEMAGGVARRPHRGEIPAGDLGPVAVLHQHVGRGVVDEGQHRHGRVPEVLELLGRCAQASQHGAHPHQQIGRVVVAVVDQRGVGRVERDPAPGRLADPAGQAVVVGVDVRDHHALHVADVEPGFA